MLVETSLLQDVGPGMVPVVRRNPGHKLEQDRPGLVETMAHIKLPIQPNTSLLFAKQTDQTGDFLEAGFSVTIGQAISLSAAPMSSRNSL